MNVSVPWRPLAQSDHIACLLEMNENIDKFEVARQKILQYHFWGGKGSIQELVGMDLAVSPRVIAWLGRDEKGFSLLYQFLQSRPSLFESGKTVKALGSKRKHGS